MPHHRVRCRLFSILCATILALTACSKSPVVDERMTGAWHASLTPIEGEWPPRELPAIARKVGEIARVWQPDAFLIGIDTELLQQNRPVVHNVDTPAGRVTLTLKFCSPDKQRSIVIASTLIAGTGVESDDATVSGPWPQMPFETRLLGLWQGEGQIDRRNVQLVWRIRSDGPSTRVRAESGKGYVETVDRSQRVILNFSGELERIGRQLKLDFHDGAVVTGFPDDDHMVMQRHNLKLLQWTRAETPSIARPEVPKSGALPRVGGAVETVEPATSSPPREPGTTETSLTQDASDAVPDEAEQATGNEEESARDKAARVGRKTVDIVEDAADTVGDFIEGVFGGQSSSGRKPDGSRSTATEFEPQDW